MAALTQALSPNEHVIVSGEDVAFGGVLRCSMNLASILESKQGFNMTLKEKGHVGSVIGCTAQGMEPVVEIYFANYVCPAFAQSVYEGAKSRYRGSSEENVSGLLVRLFVRMPCGSEKLGTLYVGVITHMLYIEADITGSHS